MNADRIALVKVEWAEDDPGFGTAFLISPRLLLTARHVVREDDQKPQKIEVRLKRRGSKWERIQQKRIRFGENGSDIAIIELRNAVPNVAAVSFLQTRDGNKDWEGAGFLPDSREPAETVYEERLTGLGGRVYDVGNATIQVGVDHGVEDAEDWRGISGGPVLIDGLLFACISDARKKFKGTRVAATPVWENLPARLQEELFGNSGEVVKAGVQSALEKAKTFVAKLKKLDQFAGCKSDSSVAERLLGLPLLDGLEDLKISLEEVLDEKGLDRVALRQQIDSAYYAAMWLLNAHGRARVVDPGTNGEGIVRAAASIAEAYADGYMAAQEQLPADLRNETTAVRAKNAIRSLPEQGFSEEGIMESFRRELALVCPHVREPVDLDDLCLVLTDGLEMRQRERKKRNKPRDLYAVLEGGAVWDPISKTLRDNVKGLCVWRMPVGDTVDTTEADKIEYHLRFILHHYARTRGED